MNQKKENAEHNNYIWNDKGMSLVTVIITIGFVSILVSILLMVSLINFKMKQVNAYAKDTFYSAEQVLDEINLGLQRSISDALSSSYAEVMTNYASPEYDTKRKNEILKTRYYEYLWTFLEKDNGHKTYDTNQLYRYLKTSTQWHDDLSYGAILRTTNEKGDAGDTGVMVTYDSKGIVLKNLTVYYKDKKGFVSQIKTDICLAYPDFDFAASTVLPDVPEYSIIADGGMVTNAPGGANMEITGNVYADFVKAEAVNKNTKISLTQKGQGQFIVKNAMELKNAAFSNEKDAAFWAKDITADSSNLTLLGESNVADDLNIKGNDSTIKLGGIYNGFGNSLTDAGESSAILVNGADATLDLSALTRITLAGHAYVGTSKKNAGEDGHVAEESKGDNVYTGESLAVKSNQLMYLLPPECVGVDTLTGKSIYLKNPLTAEEYKAIHNQEGITEVSGDVITSKLGESLNAYIEKTDAGAAQAEKVFIPTADPSQTLVYYYIKFADENAANSYFTKYYNANKASVDRYVSFYVKEIKFPNTDSLLRLKLAGNSIAGSEEKGYVNQTTGISNASTKFDSNAEASDKEFSALCTKLIKNYSELTNLAKNPDKKEQIVFENIVDADKLKAYMKTVPGFTVNKAELTEKVGNKDVTAVLVEGNYTITTGNVHLVIATGDVTVQVPNYTGTIITNGKVTLQNTVTKMTADPEVVKAMLHFSQTIDDKVYPIASVLRDGSDFMYSSLTEGEESDSVSLSNLVVYENWTKE